MNLNLPWSRRRRRCDGVLPRRRRRGRQRVHASRWRAAAVSRRSQFHTGVLQLMLDDEQTSQEAKEAIVKRPGVVESPSSRRRHEPCHPRRKRRCKRAAATSTKRPRIVSVLKPPRKALVGLGREGISEAAKAVVGVLEDNDDWTKKQAAMATMRTLIDSEVACEVSPLCCRMTTMNRRVRYKLSETLVE